MAGAERFKVKLAVYLILRGGDKVLLSLRQGTGWKDGWWSLVAGHVEAGESAEEALVRESKEEAAIVPEKFHHVYTMHRVSDDHEDDYIDLFFECDKWTGEVTNAEPDKCGELKWIDLNDVPTDTLDYIKRVLEEYPRGITYGSMEKN